MKALLQLLSPAGASARLQIFIFHRVHARPDPLWPEELHAERFDTICTWLSHWLNVLPLDRAVRRLREGSLPARAAAITFDDGYADNQQVALPILQRHGLSATFFIATGFLDGGRMWNDTLIEAVRGCEADVLSLGDLVPGEHTSFSLRTAENRRHCISTLIDQFKYLPLTERQVAVEKVARISGAELPTQLMMSSQQVRQLHRAGMGIGAHTVSHPILARLDAVAARREISQSRQLLQALLDDPIAFFAYPNGKPGTDYSDETVHLVRDLGFDAVLSTAWGAAGRGSDIYQLPRFTPWDRSRMRFGWRLAQNVWRSRGQPPVSQPV